VLEKKRIEQNPPFGRIFLTEDLKKLKIRRFVESSFDIPEEWRIRKCEAFFLSPIFYYLFKIIKIHGNISGFS